MKITEESSASGKWNKKDGTIKWSCHENFKKVVGTDSF